MRVVERFVDHGPPRIPWLRREAPDQVVSREDLDWVRARYPGIEIILCSASPKSMLEVAVEELGADRASYSTPERINSGRAKIEQLFAPIVTRASPIRAVHSATVLTREEEGRRNDGDVEYLDPRRKDRGSAEKVELAGNQSMALRGGEHGTMRA